MRTYYSLLLLISLGISTYAQQIPADTIKTRAYYLNKSKSQLTAGWIIFGVGSITLISGVIAQAAQVSAYIVTIGTSKTSNAPVILMIAGGVCMLGSIPLFISSHDNKQKAIEVSIAPILEENSNLIQMYAGKYQPAISIKISLK